MLFGSFGFFGCLLSLFLGFWMRVIAGLLARGYWILASFLLVISNRTKVAVTALFIYRIK
jgi:hypothetical protein